LCFYCFTTLSYLSLESFGNIIIIIQFFLATLMYIYLIHTLSLYIYTHSLTKKLNGMNIYYNIYISYRGEPKKISTPGDGTIVHDGSYDLMSMNGKKVYAFATREVPTVLEEALVQAGITIDQVDHLLLHQANIRIMETVAERLGISMDKVITNLHKYGNTSAASIPLALDEAVRSGRVKKGDIIACAGFGAGLSWGAAILRWG